MSSNNSKGQPFPNDLVLVGHVTGAYGIQGWIRIKPYSAEADALLHAKTWWVDKPALHDVDILQVKLHGDDVVASLMGIVDRNAAELLKGSSVQIRRSHFPALSQNEYYWVDLIGSAVENLQGNAIGVVTNLIDNGAHPILQVEVPFPISASKSNKSKELLIPFVDQFVKTVDLVGKKIVVDWNLDYLV